MTSTAFGRSCSTGIEGTGTTVYFQQNSTNVLFFRSEFFEETLHFSVMAVLDCQLLQPRPLEIQPHFTSMPWSGILFSRGVVWTVDKLLQFRGMFEGRHPNDWPSLPSDGYSSLIFLTSLAGDWSIPRRGLSDFRRRCRRSRRRPSISGGKRRSKRRCR